MHEQTITKMGREIEQLRLKLLEKRTVQDVKRLTVRNRRYTKSVVYLMAKAPGIVIYDLEHSDWSESDFIYYGADEGSEDLLRIYLGNQLDGPDILQAVEFPKKITGLSKAAENGE